MKKIVIFAFLLGAGFVAKAQVGIGTPTPVNSTMLDVDAADKGILIPRVKLTTIANFSPIEGTATESLLVYNIGTTLPKGFYFWSNDRWNQIIDQENLELSINNIINGGSGSDLGELKRVIDFLVPTNPKSGDKSLSQAALIIDPETGKIYSVSYDVTTDAYIRTEVSMQDNIKEFETRTFFKKAVVETDGQTPNFVDTNEAPDFTTAKKGEVFYQYLGEDNRIDYLNLTADVTNIIENNENIKNEITNILNQGGNVYFTTEAIGDIPANSIYYIDTDTNEKVVVDLSSTIINEITENIEIIKNEVGNKITNNEVIKTANTVDTDAVFIYKGVTKITGAKAKRVELDGKLSQEGSNIDRILAIQVFQGNKLITNAVTDVVIDSTKKKIDFNLGTGKMYVPVAEGDYEVIIEFTAK
ncbi:hypothetical protein HX004_14835 [Myroides sp. 1354]|uniref:hypothetical protein n=1 Tax=unclassified Myroides TaxID=2642485 RepID=UPI002575385E|nr:MULTISPECIES: hypothetical protein [unclassified Myroides]MDM1046138.1 hypothetical protein [Myroides sp. R163-1]MDM1057039.1 hypothetical protein [Myroides sp. 1354]MDM1070269.1 hypothetical protein [Myroides sp. 1372]